MLNELEPIGLNVTETKLYKTLLGTGCTTVNIIANHTQVNRPTVYEILKKMETKGVVSTSIQNGKLHYEAMPPKRLLTILREKENAFSRTIPLLEALIKEKIEKPQIETFVGNEGMKILFEQILEEATSFYCVAANKYLFEIFKYYLPTFVKRRIKKGIKVKLITDKIPFDKNAPYKILPSPIKTATWIYEGTVIMISLNQKTLIGVRIKEKNIYETQKLFFETIWESL
jgi:sugar-specific transcriptional regulator TrmB